ncbi:hypothetical protein [Zobellia galactanivorans]|uniref:hypothetical protein n=1 Tax=Zobellia galactanivorans (strain DSM 12802 / CCUG 47099 / CIP 106680 / NCIMB 13871 / Dsij) TaxID=63186 RepID=UPI001C0666E4|nr:hypothetical protein [Zobellia galactanivorans]MBU3025985.1 hypothetical protein [Zobellia galactanivorans]
MRRIEQLKQRHDLKKALRRGTSSASKEDSIGPDYPFLKNKDKVRTRIKRSLKQSVLKKSLRRTTRDPCMHSGSQWYTFSNPNCYNQLEEVVVQGVDKSKRRRKLNTSLVKKDHWWNKPIDVSFKNPWPEARWDLFENSQSGDFVWGSNRSGNEGRKQGTNSKIYTSYQGDDLTSAGGGAGMKFWAHLDNWAKYGIKAVQTVTGGTEQGNNVGKAIEILKEEFMQKEVSKDTQLRNLTPREKEYFLTHPNQDSLGLKKGVDTLYRYDKVLPIVEHWNGDFYRVGPKASIDTLLKKTFLKKTERVLEEQNRSNKNRAHEIFEKGDY